MADGSFNTSRRAILQAGRMIREEVREGRIRLVHIPGVVNISDILTKAEVPETHDKLSKQLNGEQKHTALCGLYTLPKHLGGKCLMTASSTDFD